MTVFSVCTNSLGEVRTAPALLGVTRKPYRNETLESLIHESVLISAQHIRQETYASLVLLLQAIDKKLAIMSAS